ncbi:MAG: AraC family transcriptional regulator [Oribacterium sp.]|jgi:AraC-like DNA-binding protein|nr:AraC family transcriptional regulator [Oribacterium sp.]MDY6308065.1 AraC family transcriptional regulator [Oribacterium sp.]
MAEGQQLTENKDIHNSRLELVFEKRIPGLRVTEAVRHRDFIMRSKHFHEDIEVHFILSGQRLLFVDKETYHLTAHSCAMVDHDLVHRTSIVPGAPPDHHNFIIHLDRSVFDGLFRALGLHGFDWFGSTYGGIVRFSDEDWALIMSIITAFKDACQGSLRGSGDIESVNSFLYLQAVELAGIYARARKEEVNRQNLVDSADQGMVVTTGIHKKVHEIALYLQEHMDENVTLEQVAEHFYMSKSYLTRVFRSVTGFSVIEYVTFLRVRKAQKLLRESDMPITDISSSLGFGNITYFEKVFKQTTGSTPGRYRKGLGKI